MTYILQVTLLSLCIRSCAVFCNKLVWWWFCNKVAVSQQLVSHLVLIISGVYPDAFLRSLFCFLSLCFFSFTLPWLILPAICLNRRLFHHQPYHQDLYRNLEEKHNFYGPQAMCFHWYDSVRHSVPKRMILGPFIRNNIHYVKSLCITYYSRIAL